MRLTTFLGLVLTCTSCGGAAEPGYEVVADETFSIGASQLKWGVVPATQKCSVKIDVTVNSGRVQFNTTAFNKSKPQDEEFFPRLSYHGVKPGPGFEANTSFDPSSGEKLAWIVKNPSDQPIECRVVVQIRYHR